MPPRPWGSAEVAAGPLAGRGSLPRPLDGVRRDIQLKGAGRTPFSRRGDGHSALGPVAREYVISEAMFALGIPTTRALAMLTTGEFVQRERPLPGGISTRVAAAHVRVGSFEYFHARGQRAVVQAPADYMIERQFPDCASAPHPYRAFLEAVIARQAHLIAQWLLVGFIHGVMNTDNMSIAGETIDYGPCAFMDAYDAAKVYSSIDHGGRYAYDQQPRIGLWNLTRFAETLLPLLAESLLATMADEQADFTLTFRGLSDLPMGSSSADAAVRALFAEPAAFDAWVRDWRALQAEQGVEDAARCQGMRAVNPAFIPRNHRVQQAIDALIEAQDEGPLDALLAVTSRPFGDQPERAEYARPPRPRKSCIGPSAARSHERVFASGATSGPSTGFRSIPRRIRGRQSGRGGDRVGPVTRSDASAPLTLLPQISPGRSRGDSRDQLRAATAAFSLVDASRGPRPWSVCADRSSSRGHVRSGVAPEGGLFPYLPCSPSRAPMRSSR